MNQNVDKIQWMRMSGCSLASPVFLEPRVISHKHCYCPFIVCNHAKTAFCVTCRWNILAGYVSFMRTLKPPLSDCFIHTGWYVCISALWYNVLMCVNALKSMRVYFCNSLLSFLKKKHGTNNQFETRVYFDENFKKERRRLPWKPERKKRNLLLTDSLMKQTLRIMFLAFVREKKLRNKARVLSPA